MNFLTKILFLRVLVVLPLALTAFLAPTPGFGQAIQVKAPKGFEEGTETRLSAGQLEELKPWATNSMIRIRDVLKVHKDKSGAVARKALYDSYQQIVQESEGKRAEILMRFVLKRAVLFADRLKDQIDANNKLANDQVMRILRISGEMALEYYESDYEFKDGVARLRNLSDKEIDYGSFAVDYVTMLMTIMESMPDISAEYTLARLAIGLFQFDLNRDLNRRQLMFSPIILGKLQPLVEKYPEEIKGDDPKYLQDLVPLRSVFIESVKFLTDPKNHVNLNLKFANLDTELGEANSKAKRQVARGDRVITNKGYWGTVLKVVGSQAVVYVDDNPGMEVREGEVNIDTAELAIQVDKFRTVVPNMKMKDYQCEELEVKEVFADGQIRAYYKKYKKSFALKIYPDGIPYSVRFKERGRECDM